MSITLMNEAWNTSLPHTRKMVLLSLCDNASDAGECYPSIARISNRCSLAERAIYDCIRDLEKWGYLIREVRNGRSTLYHILEPHKWPSTPASPAPLFNGNNSAPEGTTPACAAPLHKVQVTPAADAPLPLHDMQVTPAPHAPRIIIEPSIESSRNHQTPRKTKSAVSGYPKTPGLHLLSIAKNCAHR